MIHSGKKHTLLLSGDIQKKSVSHRPEDLFYHVSVPFILSVSVPPCDAGSIDRVKGKTAKQSGATRSFDLPDLSFSSPEEPLFFDTFPRRDPDHSQMRTLSQLVKTLHQKKEE